MKYYITHKDRNKDKNYKSRGTRSAWLKKVSNKKVRLYNKDIQGSDYKKIFDYWWSLW